MPTPLGHSIVGYTLARELGFAAKQAVVAGTFAMLPDIDMPLGFFHRRDIFAYHRGGTHTLPFAIASGFGAFGLHRRLRRGDGRRAAHTTGLLVYIGVASHLIADAFNVPSVNRREALTHERVTRHLPTTLRWEAINLAIEVCLIGVPAWLLARRRGRRAGVAE